MARRTDRKAQILELATRFFSRDGYDKVTVKRIADACGITEPAVYRHYESKEAIYDAVLESLRLRLDYGEMFATLRKETDVEHLLHQLASHIIHFFSENVDIYRLLLYAVLRGHQRAKRIFELTRGTYVKFLREQLDRLYDEGRITKKNNEITARCFIGMVFDCAMASSLFKNLQGEVYKPADVIANNVPIYARGLRQ